ncbi:DUF6980 family protein [Xylanimonas allomyrinae]|uniref:DUF6980 family protein n=1 Tax=Xylanimonas allomyrinae TaxID=2509459 RepID=UPI003CCC50A7
MVREWSIQILDGGTSGLVLDYCPFCGTRLPTSMRTAWFDRLEDLGLDPDDLKVPAEMSSDRWWRKV